jgi:hypothetical protein
LIGYWVAVYCLFWISLWRAIHVTMMASPDTIHYYARALVMGGRTAEDSIALANSMREQHGWAALPPEMMLDWDLVRPRVLYPLLASPLVEAYGWWGLILTSWILGAAFYALMAWILVRRFGAGPALFGMVVVFNCQAWFYYAIGPLTEGLSALLFALILLAVWRHRRSAGSRRWVWLVAVVLLMVAFSFTRQAMLIPAGALFAAWVGEWVRTRGARNSWLPGAATTVGAAAVTQVFQLVVFPFDQAGWTRSQVGGESTWEMLRSVPRQLAGNSKIDVFEVVKTDPGMMFAAVLLALSLILCWRRVETHLALGAGLAGAVYQAANATIHLEFRYLEPGFIVFALAITALMARFMERSAGSRDTRAPVAAAEPSVSSGPGSGG